MHATDSLPFSRRGFLQASVSAAGGLAVTLLWPRAVSAADAMEMKLPPAVAQPFAGFVRIEPDGRIVIGARGCEIGQGVRTSFPMLIAEELDVPWSAVTVEQLDYAIAEGGVPRYGAQFAGGSTSIRDGFEELRQVGARARWLLIQAASAEWHEAPERLRTRDAQVLHPGGR